MITKNKQENADVYGFRCVEMRTALGRVEMAVGENCNYSVTRIDHKNCLIIVLIYLYNFFFCVDWFHYANCFLL